MTPEERRQRANEASRRSRERRKAREQANSLPSPETASNEPTRLLDAESLAPAPAPKAPKPKKQPKQAAAWSPAGQPDGEYTHEVLNSLGSPFSIHKDAESAQHNADKIGGTVRALELHPTTYWNGTDHYDH